MLENKEFYIELNDKIYKMVYNKLIKKRESGEKHE